jgi:hypothetical protein
MSSEHIKQMGLIRAGDATKGRPDQFTVIGADISAAELIKRFDGNPWAQEVIKALKDRRAERGDPPAFFWMSLRDQGAHTAIRFVNLGNDAKGVPWLVVVDGRNRVLGLRKVNIERQALGQEAFLLKVEILNLPRGKDGIRAHLAALETKTVANISVAMRPSDNADRALDFERMGMSHLDIARKIGIRDEVAADEVPALGAQRVERREVDDGRVAVGLHRQHTRRRVCQRIDWARCALRLPVTQETVVCCHV